jgi:hypothetical protein
MKAEARQTSQPNHHAIATAGTGTGVLNCDGGGEAGVSASLLNICRVHQETISRPEQIQILRKSAHLYKYWCRLPTTNGPFPVDDREGHSGYALRTRFGYLMVHLGQALIGIQKA